MKLHLEKLIPARAEIVLLMFVGFLLSFLGNSKELIGRYGLSQSADSIGTTASTSIGQGLAKLDSYHITANIVSFMVWALVGLLTLSIVQTLLRISRHVNHTKQVGSTSYVHPENFSRRSFWRQFVLQTIVSLLVFSLAVVTIVFFCLYVLPVGLIYSKVLLLNFSLANLGYWLLGIAVLSTGLIMVDVVGRLIRFRHSLRA